jgi:hypothetical protein
MAGKRSWVVPSVVAVSLVIAGVVACLVVAGRSMGVYFGAFVALALVVPAATAGLDRYRWFPAHLAATSAFIIPALANIIAPAVFSGPAALIYAFALASAGATAVLVRARVSRTVAAAVAAGAAVAWLAWPVWTRGFAVDRLASIHPLLAINGNPAFEPWTQLPVMYDLAALGQDVYYTLPQTVWPAVTAHAGVAVVAWALVVVPLRRRRAAEAGTVLEPTGGSAG